MWEWRGWEHLDPVEDGIAEVQSLRTLWALGNRVLELPDGDLLASYRPTSTVIRIDRLRYTPEEIAAARSNW